MDELLASIRRIISGDTPAVPHPPVAGREPAEPTRVFSSSAVRVPAVSQSALPEVQSSGMPVQVEAQTMPDASHQDPGPLSAQPHALARRDEPLRPFPDAGRRKTLVSPGVDAAVTAAFESLGDAVLPTHARTVEDLMKEILRPMLKTWLDENLPDLVERLVRQEIERISRNAR